jgi:hypothetical protein
VRTSRRFWRLVAGSKSHSARDLLTEYAVSSGMTMLAMAPAVPMDLVINVLDRLGLADTISLAIDVASEHPGKRVDTASIRQ